MNVVGLEGSLLSSTEVHEETEPAESRTTGGGQRERIARADRSVENVSTCFLFGDDNNRASQPGGDDTRFRQVFPYAV